MASRSASLVLLSSSTASRRFCSMTMSSSERGRRHQHQAGDVADTEAIRGAIIPPWLAQHEDPLRVDACGLAQRVDREDRVIGGFVVHAEGAAGELLRARLWSASRSAALRCSCAASPRRCRGRGLLGPMVSSRSCGPEPCTHQHHRGERASPLGIARGAGQGAIASPTAMSRST